MSQGTKIVGSQGGNGYNTAAQRAGKVSVEDASKAFSLAAGKLARHTSSKLRVYNRTSPDRELVLKRKWIFGGGRREDTANVVRELARVASSELPEKARDDFMRQVNDALFQRDGDRTQARTIKGDMLQKLDTQLKALKSEHATADSPARPTIRLLSVRDASASARNSGVAEKSKLPGKHSVAGHDDSPTVNRLSASVSGSGNDAPVETQEEVSNPDVGSSDAPNERRSAQTDVHARPSSLAVSQADNEQPVSQLDAKRPDTTELNRSSDVNGIVQASEDERVGSSRNRDAEAGYEQTVDEVSGHLGGAPVQSFSRPATSEVPPFFVPAQYGEDGSGDEPLQYLARHRDPSTRQSFQAYIEEPEYGERLTFRGSESLRPSFGGGMDRASGRFDRASIEGTRLDADVRAVEARLIAERDIQQRGKKLMEGGNALIDDNTALSAELERLARQAGALKAQLDTLIGEFEDEPGQRDAIAAVHDQMQAVLAEPLLQEIDEHCAVAKIWLQELRGEAVALQGDDGEAVQWIDSIAGDVANLGAGVADAQELLELREPDMEALRVRRQEDVNASMERSTQRLDRLTDMLRNREAAISEALSLQSDAIRARSVEGLAQAHGKLRDVRGGLAINTDSARGLVEDLTAIQENARKLFGDASPEVRQIANRLNAARALEAQVRSADAKIVMTAMPEPVAAPQQPQRVYANDVSLGKALRAELIIKESENEQQAVQRFVRVLRMTEGALRLANVPDAVSPERLAELRGRVTGQGNWITALRKHADEVIEFQGKRLDALRRKADQTDAGLRAERERGIAQLREALDDAELRLDEEAAAVTAREHERKALDSLLGAIDRLRDTAKRIEELEASDSRSYEQDEELVALPRKRDGYEATLRQFLAAVAPDGPELEDVDQAFIDQAAARLDELQRDEGGRRERLLEIERRRDEARETWQARLDEPPVSTSRSEIDELQRNMTELERIVARIESDIANTLQARRP